MNLDAFVPKTKTVTAGGQVFEIAPLSIGALHRVHSTLGDGAYAAIATGQIPTAFMAYFPECTTALAIALNVEVAFIHALLPDEVLMLAFAVVEVNSDFFLERLLPSLRAAQEAMNKVGATSSHGLPSAGIQ